MQIIKQQKVNISEIVQALKKGKIIVYPTETCYGLGCDATNERAVNRLFDIKKRQKDKSVLILVTDLEMAGRYIEVSPSILELASKYWPGPLTIVAKVVNKANLASGVINHDETVAIRVSGHHFAHKLCEKLGVPIVSTSANISALESPYDIESILEMYKDASNKPYMIIDAGVLPHRNPSTIIKVINNGFEVLRQGDLVVE